MIHYLDEAVGRRACMGQIDDRESCFLPPYHPHFNLIEMAFAKLKALLRKAAECTLDGLWATIGRLVDVFKPEECANDFAAAGYDAD